MSGVALVGLASIIYPDGSETDSSNAALGIIILIIAQVFAAGLFVVEEKLLGDYYLDPLYIVGLEGMWGLCYYAVLLPIF